MLPAFHSYKRTPTILRFPYFRIDLGEWLEGSLVQLGILALLIIDVACVVGEIIIALVCEPEVSALEAEVTRLSEELAAATPNASAASHRYLLATPRALRGLSEASPTATTAAHGGSTMHTVEHALHITSLTILVVFAAQLLGLLVAFGPRNFARHCFYVVDAIIVITALVLESLSEPTGELIVLLLFWRVLRVLHGVMASELVAVERVAHVRKRLRAVRRRLWAARSYTATRLRMVIMRHAARDIWSWWGLVRTKSGGSTAVPGRAPAEAGAAAGRGGGAGATGLADVVVLGTASTADATTAAARKAQDGATLSRLSPEEVHEAVEDAAAAVSGRQGHWSSKLPRDERAVARRRDVDPRALKARCLRDYVHNAGHDALVEGEASGLIARDNSTAGTDRSPGTGKGGDTTGPKTRHMRRLDHALDELELDDHELN